MHIGLEVSIASAVFVERTFKVKEHFINISRQAYKSEVIQLDFQHNPEKTRHQINQ